LKFLGAETLLEDRSKVVLQGGLKDGIFIGIHRPLHDVFAEAIGGVD